MQWGQILSCLFATLTAAASAAAAIAAASTISAVAAAVGMPFKYGKPQLQRLNQFCMRPLCCAAAFVFICKFRTLVAFVAEGVRDTAEERETEIGER